MVQPPGCARRAATIFKGGLAQGYSLGALGPGRKNKQHAGCCILLYFLVHFLFFLNSNLSRFVIENLLESWTAGRNRRLWRSFRRHLHAAFPPRAPSGSKMVEMVSPFELAAADVTRSCRSAQTPLRPTFVSPPLPTAAPRAATTAPLEPREPERRRGAVERPRQSSVRSTCASSLRRPGRERERGRARGHPRPRQSAGQRAQPERHVQPQRGARPNRPLSAHGLPVLAPAAHLPSAVG